jgi:hypothetical protein
VRAALDRAEAEMPGGGDAVIGFGHMGPITWGGGIGSQARWEQAALRAALGEVEKAIHLLDGVDDAAYAWGTVLGPDLPPTTLDALMLAASNALNGDELFQLRAQTAAEMFWWEASLPRRDWARRTAREVMSKVDPGDKFAVRICSAVARVAEGAGDAPLLQAALDCAGQAALGSRDSGLLLVAAGLWSAYAPAAP